jgi:hypothetical protein
MHAQKATMKKKMRKGRSRKKRKQKKMRKGRSRKK